jgi:hypothetical protein
MKLLIMQFFFNLPSLVILHNGFVTSINLSLKIS